MDTALLKEEIKPLRKSNDDQFLIDVLKGLSANQKFLDSKYFYNAAGDQLFQQIMDCPEYYLTKCEMEIFSQQTTELAFEFIRNNKEFDVVELGAGDATKSIFLLEELLKEEISFTYFPVDISKNVIKLLQRELPQKLPSLQLEPLQGEYFPMLEKAKEISDKIKVVLFLGSNIGNIPLDQADAFCVALRSHLSVGDLVLVGFDLKKDAQVILDAYNDKAGYTAEFNLNLLQRINDELGGNFNLQTFEHYPTYDVASGACKSFLISKIHQKVQVAEHEFYFGENEKIYMEISQKYSVEQTDQLALNAGFAPIKHFFDSKKWFVDAVWQCV